MDTNVQDSNVNNRKQAINPYVRKYLDEAYANDDQSGIERWNFVATQDARYQEEQSGAERTRRNLERFFNLTNASTLLAKNSIEIINVGTTPWYNANNVFGGEQLDCSKWEQDEDELAALSDKEKQSRALLIEHNYVKNPNHQMTLWEREACQPFYPTYIEMMYNWRAPITNVLRKSRLILPYQKMVLTSEKDTSDWIWYKFDRNSENVDDEKWIKFSAIEPIDGGPAYKEMADVLDEAYAICHEYADYHQDRAAGCASINGNPRYNRPMCRASLSEMELTLNYLAITKVISSIKRHLEN